MDKRKTKLPTYLPHTSTVIAAFTSATMTVERLAHNTMLTKPNVSAALEELKNQGRVTVAGGAWTLIETSNRKGSTVTPTKKAPAKRVAAKKRAPAKKVAVKTTPIKKAVAAQKARKVAAKKVTPKSVAAVNGAKKHAKVEERDNKVLAVIVASKKTGVTDEQIAKTLGTSLGIAYQSIRRLKDEGRIDSSKGANGVTRRYAA